MAARGQSGERVGDGGKVARQERCAYGLLAGREQEWVLAVEVAAAAGRAVAASLGVEEHGTWEAGRRRLDDAVGAGHVAGAGVDAVAGDVVDVDHVAAAAAAAGFGGHRRESPWAAGRDESTRAAAAGHSGSGWDTRRIG